ncbi:MAG: GNAT family N-acetyltransferase [Bacteroidota bacterium]
MPRSPFGSFLLWNEKVDKQKIIEDFETVKSDLQSKGIVKLMLNHPAPIYPGFDDTWLKEAGFKKTYHEINQHIELNDFSTSTLHKMQQRKLDSLIKKGFQFRMLPDEELATIHQFIEVCRKTQGLEINISLELLEKLFQATQAYDLFGVYRNGKISAACIAVRVSNEVAYYYLPATSPLFRSQSPMVLLMKGMIDHYSDNGFRQFDLGISSIKGNPQETLRIFKNRMGAVETPKTSWELRV